MKVDYLFFEFEEVIEDVFGKKGNDVGVVVQVVSIIDMLDVAIRAD